MKKLVITLVVALMLAGCGEPKVNEGAQSEPQYTYEEWKEVSTCEDATTTFEESEKHASSEYWEELEYNSRENEW